MDNFIGKTDNWGLSGESSMVIMHGCEGQGSLIASYQLEVSCLLDFTYYPFDRQVKLFLYLPVPSKNFIFQTCKLEFSLPDNGLDDDTLDKLDLVWKKECVFCNLDSHFFYLFVQSIF